MCVGGARVSSSWFSFHLCLIRILANPPSFIKVHTSCKWAPSGLSRLFCEWVSEWALARSLQRERRQSRSFIISRFVQVWFASRPPWLWGDLGSPLKQSECNLLYLTLASNDNMDKLPRHPLSCPWTLNSQSSWRFPIQTHFDWPWLLLSQCVCSP